MSITSHNVRKKTNSSGLLQRLQEKLLYRGSANIIAKFETQEKCVLKWSLKSTLSHNIQMHSVSDDLKCIRKVRIT